jgi:hypothetical protein
MSVALNFEIMKIESIKYATFAEMKGEYPDILYKYRAWNDTYHQKVITHRELFYSPPSGFEDPFDCKAVVRYDLLSQSEKTKWIEYKIRKSERGKPNHYYRQKALQTFKNSPLANPEQIKKLQQKTFEEYDVRTGILSLTKNPANERMWEKYSNNGKGFCVGFKSEMLFTKLGGGGRVEYVPQLPRVMPEPIHSHDHQINFQIFYKEVKWNFEDEYRTHTFGINPKSTEERIIVVPPETFSVIILGNKLTTQEKKELIDSIPNE